MEGGKAADAEVLEKKINQSLNQKRHRSPVNAIWLILFSFITVDGVRQSHHCNTRRTTY